jgi:probable HAF family extracellular repeat protein
VTTYTYQTIDVPGSTYTVVESINASGEIVGYYQDSNHVQHGFLDNNGIYTTIDPPGSNGGTVLVDINSVGEIIGYGSRSFLYNHGTYTTIDPPGSATVYPASINKAGEIVGSYRDVNGVDHGFLYRAGTYKVLNFPVAIDPEAIDTYALSINNAGQVVGEYLDNNGRGGATHGFLYSHGTYTTIEPPGVYDSAVTSINKSGTMVGWYQTSSGGHEQGFEYSHGTYTLLEFPGAISTVPESINDKGQVTGYYQTSSTINPQHAFVYSNGQYTSIDPPGGVDPLAFSINNSGQVVGYYWGNNTDHGFLATDPPSPTNAVGNHLAHADAGTHEVTNIAGADLTPIMGIITHPHF